MVILEIHDSTALVTIDRLGDRNALDTGTIKELTRVFGSLRDDPSVRVVILTGAGDQFFSVGADLDKLRDLTPAEAADFAGSGQSLTGLIENLGKPVIAAVNGTAYGGGCELALACTWRLAVKGAEFAYPETSLGMLPGFGGSTRLPQLIGLARAFELVLTGASIRAEEALRLGLINRLVGDRVELLNICREQADQIARQAPLAVRYAFEAIRHGICGTLADGLQLESALFGLCFATDDVKEGTSAFLEKRSPVFRGR